MIGSDRLVTLAGPGGSGKTRLAIEVAQADSTYLLGFVELADRLDLDQAVAYASRTRGRRLRPRAGWGSLTPTERDVVALVTRGLSNQAIGDQLLITVGTVRTHLRSIFGKLDVGTRAELAAHAARKGV